MALCGGTLVTFKLESGAALGGVVLRPADFSKPYYVIERWDNEKLFFRHENQLEVPNPRRVIALPLLRHFFSKDPIIKRFVEDFSLEELLTHPDPKVRKLAFRKLESGICI